MSEERTEQTRIRIAYKVSAKGIFQPDVTSEAETVETSVVNLKAAIAEVEALARSRGELSSE